MEGSTNMADRVNITTGRIANLTCPPSKAQDFLRDAKSPWLAVCVTRTGHKSFVFESKLHKRTIREVIGSTDAWSIDDARQAANEKKILIDRGQDPRALRRAQEQRAEEDRREETLRSITVSQLWPTYLEKGKPRRKKSWKPRYRKDLEAAISCGGRKKKRGKGVTKPGPLFALASKCLVDLNNDELRVWFASEARRGSVQAARALSMLSGFLSWCRNQREYRDLVDRDAGRLQDFADVLPPSIVRKDALQRKHLQAFFESLRHDDNRSGAAYLVAVLLTGARREELATLRHDCIDDRWDEATLADKVDATRQIPITRHLRSLFESLPRSPGNPYVFTSGCSASGRITEPRSVLDRVLKRAGIPHVSVHGLRRSFALFAEATETGPAGAQVMGHRPSATHEKYKPRQMDILGEYLTRIQDFILATAGVKSLDGFGASGS